MQCICTLILILCKIPKNSKRFTSNPEPILILKGRHSNLAVHGRNELLSKLERIPINQQAPLPLLDHLRLLLTVLVALPIASMTPSDLSLAHPLSASRPIIKPAILDEWAVRSAPAVIVLAVAAAAVR